MWDKITFDEEWRGEFCIRKKDGAPCLKYTVALPVKSIKGDIVFSVLVMEKIAKREKRIEKLLQSFMVARRCWKEVMKTKRN
jgi:hypothetical protein